MQTNRKVFFHIGARHNVVEYAGSRTNKGHAQRQTVLKADRFSTYHCTIALAKQERKRKELQKLYQQVRKGKRKAPV